MDILCYNSSFLKFSSWENQLLVIKSLFITASPPLPSLYKLTTKGWFDCESEITFLQLTVVLSAYNEEMSHWLLAEKNLLKIDHHNKNGQEKY